MIQIRPVSDLRNKFPDVEKSANDLLDEVETAILERQPVAESFEMYRSLRERSSPYIESM